MEMRIAIIEENVLTAMGLQQILEDIIPMALIQHYPDFESLCADHPEQFVHFFISSTLYFEHATYFQRLPRRSIVLMRGHSHPHLSGLLTLNVCQDVKSLVKDILMLHSHGHGGAHGGAHTPIALPNVLSSRELEVAMLLARGHRGKEIADQLCISLSTVVTHRRNIMEKLHARSLADVIVYLVTHNILRIEDL